MSDFTIKQNDTSPALVYTLGIFSEGSGILTGATAVLNMRKPSGTVVGLAMTIEDVDGVLKRSWGAGDLSETGTYQAEVEVTYADSAVETFPNFGYLIFKVVPEVA